MNAVFWIYHWTGFVSNFGDMKNHTCARQCGMGNNKVCGERIVQIHGSSREKQIISVTIIDQANCAESFMDMIWVLFCNEFMGIVQANHLLLVKYDFYETERI